MLNKTRGVCCVDNISTSTVLAYLYIKGFHHTITDNKQTYCGTNVGFNLVQLPHGRRVIDVLEELGEWPSSVMVAPLHFQISFHRHSYYMINYMAKTNYSRTK